MTSINHSKQMWWQMVLGDTNIVSGQTAIKMLKRLEQIVPSGGITFQGMEVLEEYRGAMRFDPRRQTVTVSQAHHMLENVRWINWGEVLFSSFVVPWPVDEDKKWWSQAQEQSFAILRWVDGELLFVYTRIEEVMRYVNSEFGVLVIEQRPFSSLVFPT